MKPVVKTILLILALFSTTIILGIIYFIIESNIGREALLRFVGASVVYSIIGVPSLIGGILILGLLAGETIFD